MQKLGKAVHVFSKDPALRQPTPPAPDATAEELAANAADSAAIVAAYARAREAGTAEGLHLVEGRTPILWRLQGLSMHGWEEVGAEGKPTRLCRKALQRGLVSAEGAIDADGKPLRIVMESDGVEQCVNYATMEALFRSYGHDLIVELGFHVLELSDLRPQFGQG